MLPGSKQVISKAETPLFLLYSTTFDFLQPTVLAHDLKARTRCFSLSHDFTIISSHTSTSLMSNCGHINGGNFCLFLKGKEMYKLINQSRFFSQTRIYILRISGAVDN